jgi:toxin CcdB
MARFDFYANPGGHATSTPYVLDVQCGLPDGLDSRVVIPWRRVGHFPNVTLAARLTPVL